MPLIKLSDKDRKKIREVKRRCPCITQNTLAYIFDVSPSTISETLREKKNDAG